MESRIQLSSLGFLTFLLVVGLHPAEASADDELRAMPVVEFAPGVAAHFAPSGATHPQFTCDLDSGAFIMLGEERRFAINPQLGYTYDHMGLNAFNLAFGFGVGNPVIYATYIPRLIAGTLDHHGAIGMRNSLGANVSTTCCGSR